MQEDVWIAQQDAALDCPEQCRSAMFKRPISIPFRQDARYTKVSFKHLSSLWEPRPCELTAVLVSLDICCKKDPPAQHVIFSLKLQALSKHHSMDATSMQNQSAASVGTIC